MQVPMSWSYFCLIYFIKYGNFKKGVFMTNDYTNYETQEIALAIQNEEELYNTVWG